VAEPPKLEEVPMLPPYAVRGGLKERAKLSRSTRVASGTFTPDVATIPAETAHAPNPAMDFEFDQLDFDNLDLGLADDMEIEAPDPLLALGIEGQMLQDQLMPAFGSFDMQQNQTMDGNLMSEHDLRQLSGYMAGFQQ
jgi:hypothetical protein